MKHIIVSDIHGKDVWKEINIKKYDKVVFLGDYVDHFTAADFTIESNLEHIINFKKRHSDKVELLLGNHDIQYLYYPHFQCSGFRPTMQRGLTYLFNKHKKCFNVAYGRGNYLFTHAGVTNAWYNENIMSHKLDELRESSESLAELLNQINESRYRHLLHTVGYHRNGEGNGGITWADRKETMTDTLHGYHQIVGHTPVEETHTVSYTGRSVTYTDILSTKTYFHEIKIP
jgi:predicted phosphodiesterase